MKSAREYIKERYRCGRLQRYATRGDSASIWLATRRNGRISSTRVCGSFSLSNCSAAVKALALALASAALALEDAIMCGGGSGGGGGGGRHCGAGAGAYRSGRLDGPTGSISTISGSIA